MSNNIFNLKLNLKLIEQADCDRVRSDGRYEYTAYAIDEKENGYIITWLSYKNGDELIEAGLEDDVCNWNMPYSIRLIEEAENNE